MRSPWSPSSASPMSATSTAAVSGGNVTYNIDYEGKALELTFYLVTQLHWIWRHYPGRVAGTEEARHRRVGGYLRQHQQGIFLLDLPRRPEIHFGMDCQWSRFSTQGRPLTRRSRVAVEIHWRRLQDLLNNLVIYVFRVLSFLVHYHHSNKQPIIFY